MLRHKQRQPGILPPETLNHSEAALSLTQRALAKLRLQRQCQDKVQLLQREEHGNDK